MDPGLFKYPISTSNPRERGCIPFLAPLADEKLYFLNSRLPFRILSVALDVLVALLNIALVLVLLPLHCCDEVLVVLLSFKLLSVLFLLSLITSPPVLLVLALGVPGVVGVPGIPSLTDVVLLYPRSVPLLMLSLMRFKLLVEFFLSSCVRMPFKSDQATAMVLLRLSLLLPDDIEPVLALVLVLQVLIDLS